MVNTQNIDYNTLTTEQLEEYAEFVDWSLVPSELITEKIKKSFEPMSKLKTRLWFEDLLKQMVIKEDKKKYPQSIFFFIDEFLYMEIEFKNRNIWCSDDRIWLSFENKTEYKYKEIQIFIKNLIKIHLKNINLHTNLGVEDFKNFSVFHITWDSVTEKHFQNKKII